MAFKRGNGSNDTFAGGEENDVYFGQKGNDVITGDAGNDVLYGGAGNDNINGGEGVDVLFGDVGNDTITGGEGDDFASGGVGNDVFIFTDGSGSDISDGDVGTDVLDYSALTASMTFGVASFSLQVSDNMEDGYNLGEAYDFEKVIGAAGQANTLDGTSALTGFTVDLSKALQTVSGLMTIKNLVNFTNVTGGQGNDTLTGSDGDNVLSGGNGNDLIYAGKGNDTYDGGEGNDKLDFTKVTIPTNSALTMGLADGSLSYSTVTVSFSGFETLIGAKGKADIIDGSELAAGMDGEGIVLDMSSATGSILLTGAAEGLGSLTSISGFEIVKGGEGNDRIIGDKGNNTLFGNGGNDSLSGGDGNDLFNESGESGAGSDELDGGKGTDVVNYGTNVEEVVFNLVDGTVTIGEDVDTLTGIETITLSGTYAHDTFDATGFETALTITMATGKVTGLAKTAANPLTAFNGFEHAKGGSGNDKILSGDTTTKAVANNFDGGDGNDSLDGGFGADTLDGGDGNDTLLGVAGDDVLIGGGGDDKLIDKLGNDTYKPLSGEEAGEFGTDTIQDSAGTEDVLDLSLWDAESVTFTIGDGSDKGDKQDALIITTDDGVIIIEAFFKDTIASGAEYDADDLVAGTGVIESILLGGDVTYDFADIKALLLGEMEDPPEEP